MNKLLPPFLALLTVLALACGPYKSKDDKHSSKLQTDHLHGIFNQKGNLPFDSNLVSSFYHSYPELGKYKEEVIEVYRQHHYTEIWFDKQGVVEFGHALYSKAGELNDEGISSRFPYQAKIDGIFTTDGETTLSQVETELMLTNFYLFYIHKVYKGLGDSTTTAIGWFLPRKQISYTGLIDSLIADHRMLNSDDSSMFSQYYKLRDVLKRYREIGKKGGWKPIDTVPMVKSYKPGDTGNVIRQIRERLYVTGELKQDSKSNRFDSELAEAVKTFKQHTGFNPGKNILPEHIREMNIPVDERIKTIIVNMERCRWISPEFSTSKVYIMVNIPSFKLTMVRDGKIALESPVIVGDNLTETVIFKGMMSQVIFSPYWKVPVSVIEKEIKPGMAKNKNYLKIHNMEWNKGQVRQRPGKNNSLGLVKFIFPNTEDIYMHDTPAKNLFSIGQRALSHGCIRVAKSRDLAVAVLEDDPAWTPKKIDAAMHKGVEKAVRLKSKIPVYIGYMTALVDGEGEINFYQDVYKRDERLTQLLLEDK